MQIDERYLNILASNAPGKNNKWFKRMGLAGFVIIAIGIYFLSSAMNAPIETAYDETIAKNTTFLGIGLGIAGVGLLITSVTFSNKQFKKRREAFLEYYKNHGHLPPWPEQ